MMKRAALASLLIVSSGCTTAAPPPEEDVPVHGGTSHKCDASRAQHLVGRPADAAVGQEALRLTGAGTLRWIRPGDMVTMDYRPDRLNIELDERHRVKELRCG